MDVGGNDSVKVLGLVIPLKDRVGLITLSDRFNLSLEGAPEVRSPSERVRLLVSFDAQDAPSGAESSVQSITVVYGENGWGKTHSMIEACKSLSSTKGERQVAILWERGSQIFLDAGGSMKGRISAIFDGYEIQNRTIDRPFNSVFYTTSPFEAAKRRSLRVPAFADVSPLFSPANPFEGAALLRAFSKLPDNFPFIKTATVLMRIKLPKLALLVKKAMPNERAKEASGVLLSQKDRVHVERIIQALDSRAKQVLVAELMYALEDGVGRGSEVLLHLLSHATLNFGDTLPLSEYARTRLSDSVVAAFALPFQIYDADQAGHRKLYKFVATEMFNRSKEIGKVAGLERMSSSFEDFDEEQWNLLQQATQSGFVSWSFNNLSSGQVALLMLFSSLASALTRLAPGRPAFIFIDEGEMFMHPAWQRRYITDLLDFIGRFPQISAGLHVILATHSMIVAADAPPNRLFNVKTGDMTNGFGYGPKDMLKYIYGVSEFQGLLAGGLMERLIAQFRNENGSDLNDHEACTLASNIADERLKRYMLAELRRRAFAGGAQ